MERNEALKSHVAIRCVKAAILLSSLKSSGISCFKSTNDDKDESQEREMILKRAVEDLKTQVVKERAKSRNMRLCSATELLLQITILLSLWSLCLMLAFIFL